MLIDFWLRDDDLGKAVAGLPWIASTPIGEEVYEVLSNFRAVADADLELAKRVLGYPWVSDGGLTGDEWLALGALGYIASTDIDLARQAASLPWVTDGATAVERNLLFALGYIASTDLELAGLVAGLPWFTDGVTEYEMSSLYALSDIASTDLELARLVAGLPWFTDGVTEYEPSSLYALSDIASTDLELARLVAGLPWFTDGVTEYEMSSLYALSDIASINLELARLVVNLPWIADGVGRDGVGPDLGNHFLRSLRRQEGDTLGELASQPCIADGLDPQEAVLAVTLSNDSPEFCDLPEAYFVQTRSVSLPLSGDVNIWVVQDISLTPDEGWLTLIEDSARIIEGFLRTPFPTTDIILMVEEFDGFPHHAGTHIKVSPGGAGVVPHEMAHYFGFGRLNEGAAQFIAAYVRDRTGGERLADRMTFVSQFVQGKLVEDVENILHCRYLSPRPSDCVYLLVEDFMYMLFETIGEEAMASALGEINLLVSDGQNLGWDDESEVIFDTFLKHTPPERQEEFRDVYRRLHGGPYPGPDVDLSDDHGDEAAVATEVAVGEVVEGALDYNFDFDYFRFRAEEGQRYRIGVNHETLRATSVMLYGPDGQTQEQWVYRWTDSSRVLHGAQMRWIAPDSDDYYLAVQNFGGKSGQYTLTISSVETIPDDHGDSAADATDISIGDAAEAAMDYDFDFDLFRFQAVAGQTYRLSIEGLTLPLSRVRVYAPDGVTWTQEGTVHHIDEAEKWKPPSWGCWLRRWSDGVEYFSCSENPTLWVAPTSGEYYLVVDGGYGSVGTYRLEIHLNR